MNRRIVWLSALLAVVMFSTVAQAQRQRQGQRRGGFGGPSLDQIVSNKAVQKDIAATEQQCGKIEEAAAAARVPRGNRQELEGLSDEARRAKMRESSKKRQAATEQLQAKLAEILDAKQMARVEQIQRQAMGLSGLIRNRESAKALGLTREQQKEIQGVVGKMTKELRGSGEKRNAAETRKTRAKIDAKIKEMLTEDQAAKLKELLGPPFDMTQLRPQRKGRGRRPGN